MTAQPPAQRARPALLPVDGPARPRPVAAAPVPVPVSTEHFPVPEKFARLPLADIRFILLDTETTGLGEAPKIIEVAARGWSIQSDRKYPGVFETLLDPGEAIPPGSSAVHHITDKKVAGKPALKEVLPDFQAFIGDSPIVAYNAAYDRGVLIGTPLHSAFWLDAYRMAMHIWHIGEENRQGFKLQSFKQQELRYWLELPDIQGDAHRAGADILLTGLILKEIAQKYLRMGCPDTFGDFVDWVRSPILHETVPMGNRNMVGKRPEEIETWALKKVFNPEDPLFPSFKEFNVHDFLRPEYTNRMALESPRAKSPKP